MFNIVGGICFVIFATVIAVMFAGAIIGLFVAAPLITGSLIAAIAIGFTGVKWACEKWDL